MNIDHTSNIVAGIIKTVEMALIQIGNDGVNAMQKNIEDNGTSYTGRLIDSISFATNTGASKMSEQMKAKGDSAIEDMAPKPDVPKDVYAVNIGTRVPYAKYVNYGSMPYQGGSIGPAEPNGSFKERLTEWIRLTLGLDGPELEDAYYVIARKIMENGTDAAPFFEPAFPDIRMSTQKNLRVAAKELGKNIVPKTIIVNGDGTQMRGTKPWGASVANRKEAFSEMNPEHLVR